MAITAALGFDSFLVMRHGAGIDSVSSTMASYACTDEDNECLQSGHDGSSEFIDLSFYSETASKKQRLGCYFCNDVVAPQDVTPLSSSFCRFTFLFLFD